MISRIVKYLTVPMVLGVVGCATAPQTTNYYLIESLATKGGIDSDQQIVLYPIQLSDYLKSNNLHVKSKSGEVLYSATDQWAERPSKMLWRVMQQSLEDKTSHHVLTSYEAAKSCAQIEIKISELSSNVDGEVVSKGRWFIRVGDETQQTNKFLFTGNIEVDGYAAANKLIASHLHELSRELEQQITSLGLCQKHS